MVPIRVISDYIAHGSGVFLQYYGWIENTTSIFHTLCISLLSRFGLLVFVSLGMLSRQLIALLSSISKGTLDSFNWNYTSRNHVTADSESSLSTCLNICSKLKDSNQSPENAH